MYVCGYVHVRVVACGRVRFPGTGVAGGCGVDLGAVNQTPASEGAAGSLNC